MNEQRVILLFDGVCNLCSGAVNFILKNDKKKLFRFVPLQSDEGKLLISELKLSVNTDSVIFIHGNQVFLYSDAIIEISKLLGVPWKWLSVFSSFPVKFRNRIYRWIAKNRYRWFGKRKTCRVM